MEWLGQAVVVALCGSATNKSASNYGKLKKSLLLEATKRGSVLCVYVADQATESVGENAIAAEPVLIVKSSMGGLPAEFSNSEAIFFVKTDDCVIPSATVASQTLDYGIIRNSSLKSLANVVENVYSNEISSNYKEVPSGRYKTRYEQRNFSGFSSHLSKVYFPTATRAATNNRRSRSTYPCCNN